MNADWRTRARCTPDDAHRFTPEHTPPQRELAALAAICHHCPVALACATYAADNRLHGFYAGTWIPTGYQHPNPTRSRPLSLSKGTR